MSFIRNAVAGLASANANTCLRIVGMPPTVRIVTNPRSTLIVVAAPVSATREVLAALGSATDEAFTYGLVGRKAGSFGLVDLAARIGSTERPPAGRLRRHLATPPIPGAETFFVVAGRTTGILTPDLARGLEAELARQTGAANRYSIVGTYAVPTLTATSRLIVDHWIGELRTMLADAGIPLLVENEDGPEATGDAPEVLKAGYSLVIPAGLRDAPDRRRWELRAGKVRAHAVCAGGAVVVEAGARGRKTSVPSHQPCIKRKFAELCARRILVSVPGRSDLVEAARPFRVPSLVNAARLLLGTNDSGRGWRQVA